MAGEVAHWRANSAAERQLTRDIAAIQRRAIAAQAEVQAVGQVTRYAVHEVALTSLACDAAERIAPSGTELYRLQAMTGAMEIAEVIRNVRTRW